MSDEHDEHGSMKVDTALVRELAELLGETGLTEIEVEDGKRKIRVAKTLTAAPVAYAPAPAPAAAPVAAAPTAAAPAAAGGEDLSQAVRSPMVGTAYLAANPEAAPFVKEGATVKAGDTLVIIEAMKVMNPILAPRAGTVTRVIVENGQPVEFDQPLVILA